MLLRMNSYDYVCLQRQVVVPSRLTSRASRRRQGHSRPCSSLRAIQRDEQELRRDLLVSLLEAGAKTAQRSV